MANCSRICQLYIHPATRAAQPPTHSRMGNDTWCPSSSASFCVTGKVTVGSSDWSCIIDCQCVSWQEPPCCCWKSPGHVIIWTPRQVDIAPIVARLRDLFAAEMGYKSGSQTRALTRGTFSLDNLTELVAVLLDLSPRALSCGDLCVQRAVTSMAATTYHTTDWGGGG